MNMYSQGVDPGLDFSQMPKITQGYTAYTGMAVSPRQPYAGELVFAAFSGSHQDAIAKGMAFRAQHARKVWDVPYLPIDPKDVGREYESDVIRINSQSGKGGVGYVLQTAYGVNLPAGMKEDMSYKAKHVSDVSHRELKPADIYEVFEKNYLSNRPVFDIPECHFKQEGEGIECRVTISRGGKTDVVCARGNGRLDAVSNAVKAFLGCEYTLTAYEQHALTSTSSSKAISYVGIQSPKGAFYGAGIDDDIIKSSYKALASAVNNLLGQNL